MTPIEKKYKDDAYFLGLNIFNIRDPEPKAPLSEETKHRMSLSKIGNKSRTGLKNSDNQKQIMKNNKFSVGRKHTEEWKQKNSLRMKGNKHAKGSKVLLGKKLSETHKKNLSLSHIGKNLGNKSRSGQKQSIEERKKKSISHKEIWRIRKEKHS